MNSPIAETSAPAPLDIANVRVQIDAIDSDIAALVARRCGLSASVAAAKRANGDTSFGWRPAREVEIVRTVMHQQASLNPALAFSIWRALISANLAAQGDLTIATLPDAAAAARSAFGVGTQVQALAGADLVLDVVARNDHAIGVLPWPTAETSWWVIMMDPAFAHLFARLFVCAATPLVPSDQAPEALLIAARAPEAAGGDKSLIAGPSDAIGVLSGELIARANGLSLLLVDGFHEPTVTLPTGCRLLGCYALA